MNSESPSHSFVFIHHSFNIDIAASPSSRFSSHCGVVNAFLIFLKTFSDILHFLKHNTNYSNRMCKTQQCIKT